MMPLDPDPLWIAPPTTYRDNGDSERTFKKKGVGVQIACIKEQIKYKSYRPI